MRTEPAIAIGQQKEFTEAWPDLRLVAPCHDYDGIWWAKRKPREDNGTIHQRGPLNSEERWWMNLEKSYQNSDALNLGQGHRSKQRFVTSPSANSRQLSCRTLSSKPGLLSGPPKLREHCGRGGGKNVRVAGWGVGLWHTVLWLWHDYRPYELTAVVIWPWPAQMTPVNILPSRGEWGAVITF